MQQRKYVDTLINGVALESVEAISNLGVMFDGDMQFTEHVKTVGIVAH